MIQVKIQGLSIDPTNNSPIVLLKEHDGERTLPIWIGLLEATAIASELENITFSRPMTHDLFINALQALGWSLIRVEIVDLRDNIFYASLHVNNQADLLITLDSRPSDALALALRADVPIFVASHVLDGVAPQQPDMDNQEKWRELLERMSPEDFGKYKM